MRLYEINETAAIFHSGTNTEAQAEENLAVEKDPLTHERAIQESALSKGVERRIQ